jgi:hypothetical protein
MKIISKYKDYYDYLSDIYGVDPKLVLDRRADIIKLDLSLYHEEKILIYLCDYVYEGFCYNGKVYFQDDVNQFSKEKNIYSKSYDSWYRNYYHLPNIEHVSILIKNEKSYINIAIEAYKDPKKLNVKNDCPIIIQIGETFYNYISLKSLNINTIIGENDMYNMLSSWISKKVSASENYVDDRSDKLKLESKGFDNKRSFRPKSKK